MDSRPSEDITDIIELNFSAESDELGQMKVRHASILGFPASTERQNWKISKISEDFDRFSGVSHIF